MGESLESVEARIERVNREVHTSVKEFNESVQKITRLMTEDEFLAFHRKISLDALRSVVLLTPVDTGRARGGWQSSTQGFRKEPVKRLDKDGGAAIDRGARVIDKLKLYGFYYLSNAVDYIVYLEDGHSNQSRDMVKTTVNRLRDIVRD